MNQLIKILQITDLHLFSDPQAKLVGINSLKTLHQVIAKILDNIEQNRPDLIVLSGDVSQDYSLESYKIAAKILQQFKCPIVGTAGNHDYLPFFSKIFGNPTQVVTKISDLTNWRIILLNSHLSQHVDGRLGNDELNFLQESLDKNSKHPVIIFIHHHVLPVSSTWIDKIKLQNGPQFLEIIDRYKNIKAVVCGHIHQETSITRQNVIFLSTPSTSWQFTVKSDGFKLDTLMPGYRWINLYDDGTIQTEVVRIEHNDEFIPDTNSKGY
ncbi:MAG: 3',5'-cyclic-AMP phosphodiesterase [Gammaproteobacteria bacterium]|nr:3',5'-cyclic-AMP phosphodiesterase [Gammaproteobacteria bacterium]